MFCYNCGKQLPDGARFCGQCGAAVKIPAKQAPQPKPAAQPEPKPVPQPEPKPKALEPVRAPKKQRKAAGLGKGLLIAVLAVAIIVAAAVFVVPNLKLYEISYVTHVETIYPDGGEVVTAKYHYPEKWTNAETFQVEVKVLSEMEEMPEDLSLTYIYSAGVVRTENSYSSTTVTEIWYDEAGNMIAKLVEYKKKHISNGITQSYTTFDRDDRGLITAEYTEQEKEDGSWITLRPEEYSYSREKGLYVRETGSERYPVTTWFNDKARVVEMISYLDGRELDHSEYTYDQDGNLLRQEKYRYGELVMELEYHYDTIRVSRNFLKRFPTFCRVK